MKLNDHMIREADYWANKRQENAEIEGRTPGNDLIPGPDDLAKHIRGCRAERAGKVLLDPIEWHKFKTGSLRNLADLGDFVDVKAVDRTFPKQDHALIVPIYQLKRDWAYLLVGAEEHPYYWMVGWLWGQEIHDRATTGFLKRTAYFIRAFDQRGKFQLHPPYLLQREARARSK